MAKIGFISKIICQHTDTSKKMKKKKTEQKKRGERGRKNNWGLARRNIERHNVDEWTQPSFILKITTTRENSRIGIPLCDVTEL